MTSFIYCFLLPNDCQSFFNTVYAYDCFQSPWGRILNLTYQDQWELWDGTCYPIILEFHCISLLFVEDYDDRNIFTRRVQQNETLGITNHGSDGRIKYRTVLFLFYFFPPCTLFTEMISIFFLRFPVHQFLTIMCKKIK